MVVLRNWVFTSPLFKKRLFVPPHNNRPSCSRLLCTAPEPKPRETGHPSAENEPKVDAAREKIVEKPDKNERKPKFEKKVPSDTGFGQERDETKGSEYSLIGRMFNRLKMRMEEAATAPLPSIDKRPMIKGFSINEVDKSLLVFPEFDETSEVMELETFAQKIERLITEKLDSAECDQKKHLPAEFLKSCIEMGLFGLSIPKEYGGLGLNNKSIARCHEELSRDWSLYTLLNVHNDLVAQAIKLFGTDQQKAKYLPRLASGQSIGAFCLHEESCGQDMASIETTVSFSKLGENQLVLNGTKSWILNAVNADILLVFAKMKSFTSIERKNIPTTAFLIDRRESSGITDLDRKDTMGLRATNISGLKFDNVEITSDNILSVEENGFHVAQKSMAANRFAFAAAAAACLKRIFSVTAQHCNATKRWGAMLSDANVIRSRLTKIAADIYALETMAYFMAGWLDDDPTRDFSLESAVSIRFARKALRRGTLSFMEIFGANAFTTSMELERLLRDIITMSGFVSTDDFLSGYVAMETFKVYAAEHKKVLYKAKNAIQFPWHAAVDQFKRQDLYREAFVHKHYLNEHVHPSLESCCRFVEETMAKFDTIFKNVVYSTGKAVEDESIILERVTDILTNLFIMITAISRASRSYCIGLRNADQEMKLTDLLCTRLRIETMHLLKELCDLDCATTVDILIKELGTTMLNHRGYALERPITRNW